MSCTWRPGGSDCLSFSALSASVTHSVYRYLLQRTLNLVTVPLFLIFTDRASFRRAVSRKSLVASIFLGIAEVRASSRRLTKKVFLSICRECVPAALFRLAHKRSRTHYPRHPRSLLSLIKRRGGVWPGDRTVARIRTHELRTKSKQDLMAVLKELKTELAALRVAKVTGGASNKLSKIKTVRDSRIRLARWRNAPASAVARGAYEMA
jgi:ribosomal protein L29